MPSPPPATSICTVVVTLQGYSRESFNAQLREQFVAGLATALLITPVSVIILAVTSAPPAPAVGRRALRQAGVVSSPPPPPAPPTGGSVSVLVAIYEPGPGGLTAVEVVNRLSTLSPLTLAVALRQAGLTGLAGVTTSNLVFTRPWPSPPLAPLAPPHPPHPLPPKHETVAETAKLAAGVGGAVGGFVVLSLAVGLSLCLYRRHRARKQANADDEAVPAFKMDTPMWTAADLPLVSKVTAEARSRHNWDSAGEDGSAHELATRLISILPPLPQPPLPRTFDPNELPDTQEASSAALAAIFAPPGATPDEREMPYINTWQNERVAAAAILVDEAAPLLPVPRAQREAAAAAAELEHRKHRSRERSGSRHRRHDDNAPDGERRRHRHRHRSSSRRREEEAALSGERSRRTPYAEASGDPAAIPTRSGEVRMRSRSRSTPRYGAEADSVAMLSGDGRAGSPVRDRSDRRHHRRPHGSPRRGHGDSDLDGL